MKCKFKNEEGKCLKADLDSPYYSDDFPSNVDIIGYCIEEDSFCSDFEEDEDD